jgi:hypothetical protein
MEVRGRAAPALVKGTPECTRFLEWTNFPWLAPAWWRYPPHTIDADGNVEFLRYNLGWVATSGRDLERRFKIGHDRDARRIAERAKRGGHIEDWQFLGGQIYVKLPEDG